MLSREDQKAFVDLFRQDQKKKIQQNQQKWYAGEQPTGAEALARIYTIGQTDSERGRKLYDQFRQLQNDSTSPFYNPYRQATSRAARELTALGLDTSGGINDDFFKKYSGLQKYYTLGTNGTPVSPGKRASNEEKAAYWYYQAYQDEENTKKAEKEWDDLRKAIYSAANSSRPGATDDEILSKIDMSKYKTLAKLDEGKSIGAPMSLNRGIGYSKDALNGVLWAIRNGGGTGDSEKDSIYAVMGKGNSAKTLEDEWKQWVEENRAPLAITSDRVFDTGKKFRQPGVMQSIQAMQPDNPLTGKNIDYELNGKKYTRHVPGMLDQINAAEQYYQDQGKEEEKQRKAELDSMYKWEIKPIGRYGKGNIDLYNRPTVQNEDGTISTLYSFSFNEDGKEILIPSVIRDKDGKGRIVSEEEAIDHYHKTGEYLGKFNTVAEADKYADKLHKQGEYIYFWKNGELAPDYQRKQEEPVSFMQASLEQNKAKNEADHNARLKAWAEQQKAYSQAFNSAKANGQSEGVSAAVASIMTGAGAGAGNTAPVTAPSAKDIRDNTHAANYLRNSGIFDNGDDKWLWSDKKIASDIKALQDKKAEYQHWAGIVDQAADQDLYGRLNAYFMGGALRGAKSGQDLSDRDPDDVVSGAIYDAMHGEGAWASIIKEPTEEDAIASLQEQRMQEDPWATNDIQFARSGQGYHLMSVDPLAVEQEYSRLYREWEARFDSAYDEAQGYYDLLFNTQDPDKAFEAIKGYNHNAVNQLIMGGDNQFDQEIRNLEKVQKEWADISRMENEAPQDADSQYIPANDVTKPFLPNPANGSSVQEEEFGDLVDIIYHRLHEQKTPSDRFLYTDQDLADVNDVSYFASEQQKRVFNSYYNKGMKDEAMAYWEAIQPSLQAMKTKYQAAAAEERANGPQGWLESLYSIGVQRPVANLMGTIGAVGAVAGLNGADDPRSIWYSPLKSDQATRQARGVVWGNAVGDLAERVFGENTKEAGERIGNMLYGVAASMGDNMYAMALASPLKVAAPLTSNPELMMKLATGTVQLVMSSGAMAESMLDNLENNRSPLEATVNALMSGAIEAATEKYSIEALWADPSRLGKGWLRKYITKNFVTEGSEEIASDILNMVEDVVTSKVFGHNNEFEDAYEKYRDEGLSQNDAVNRVLMDKAGTMAESFISGALSGGLFGLGGAAVNAASNPNITQKDIGNVVTNNDQVQSLIELGMASKDGRVQQNAKKMSEKIRQGKKLSFRELGRLYTNISETESERTTAAVTESVQNTVKERLHEIYDGRENISTGDISDMAEAVAVAVINPDQLTRRQQTLLKEHAAAGQLVKDMSAEAEMDVSNPNYQIVQDAFKAAEKAGAEGRKNSVKLQDILYRQNSPEAAAQSAVQTAKTADAETVQLARQATGERTATMRDVVIDGRIGEVAGYKDGYFVVNVKAEDGSTVKRNVSYAELEAVDPKMAAVANYVETYQTGLSDSYKSRLINGIGAYNGDAISYLTETRNATIAGWIASDIGKTVDHISGTGNQELINSFYNEAKNDYEADEREWLKQAREYKFKANNTIRINGVSRDDAEAWDTAIGELAQDQRDQINIINALADGVGMNVEYVSRDDLPNMYGSYNDGTMTINMKGQDRTSKGQILHSMLAAAGHEMTHHFKFTAPKAYKAMRQYMLNYLHDSGTDVVDMVRRLWDNNNAFIGKNNGERSNAYSLADAVDEVMANGADQVMTNAKFINKLKQDNPSLFGKMQNFVQNFLNKISGGLRGMNARSASYTARQFREVQDEIAEKWHVALQETIQNRQAQFSGNAEDAAPGTVAEAVVEATDKETGYVNDRMAEAASEAVDENGNQLFSVASMEHDKQKYRQMLVNTGLMKQSEIDNLFDIIDSAISVINEDGNRDILDLNEDYGPEGRAFNPVKPNSDSLYKVSLDFSTLCRKRLLQQILQEKIEKKYNTVMTKAERVALRNALKELQAEGKRIEIACALCYVESARLKSPAQIVKFMNDKRGKIIDYLSKNDPEYKNKIQDAVDEMTVGFIDPETGKNYEKGTPMSKMAAWQKKAIQTMKRKMYEEYKPTLNESREIEAAMTMDESYFKTASGLAQLKKDHPMVFDAYTTFVRNATKSKGLEGDVPFYAGDTETISDSLIQAMNAENGLRSQSWSDFQVYHMLDYIGAIIELSTRNAKMQAYTKVADYAKLMGNTGQMINLSLIPTDYDGKTLGYDPKEGMDYATMQKLRNEFHETVGNICIGISDDHIRALLASDDIDYVIPYHKSSMDKATRAKIGLKNWSEYEAYQNETNRDYNTTDRYAEDYHRHTKFSDWYNLGEARKSYEKHLNELTKNGKIEATVALKWQASNLAMRDMADNYIELCHRRGLQEKFAQFSDEDGYWKLLIDRKMIDQKTGELIEQKAVRPVFNKADILEILHDEVKRVREIQPDMDYVVDNILNRYGEIRKAAGTKAVQQEVKAYDESIVMRNIVESAKDMDAAPMRGTAAAASSAPMTLDNVQGEEVDYAPKKQKARYADENTRLSVADPEQKKNADYNAAQTTIGSRLKTLKGSPIARSTKGVGKLIGGEYYVHRDYATDIIPADTLSSAEVILSEQHPDFDYNCIKYNPKTNVVTFQEAPDFDTAREPVVGDYVSVNVNDGTTKTGHSNYIWHHKWEWVKNDYKGFDVGESWNWSKRWLSTLTEVSDGNGIARWNAQLDRFGLPHDGESEQHSAGERTQYSVALLEKPLDSSNKELWEPGKTEAEVREFIESKGYTLFPDPRVDGIVNTNQEDYHQDPKLKAHLPSEGKVQKGQGTQIEKTISTYIKIYEKLKADHPDTWKDLRILDASSGLGYGTAVGRAQSYMETVEEKKGNEKVEKLIPHNFGFNVTDIEPYYGEGYNPDYVDYIALERDVREGKIEPFDYIISNAVLNVVAQDVRDGLVAAMNNVLKPGGQMFINVINKGYKADSAIVFPGKEESGPKGAAKGKGAETYNPKSRSVQKQFSKEELIAYLHDALGKNGADYEITKSPYGMMGVYVTKPGNTSTKSDTKLSISDREYMDAINSGDMNAAQKMVDEAAKAAGYTRMLFHGTSEPENIKVFRFGRNGIYTTSDSDIASTYGKKVYPLYGQYGAKVLTVNADGNPHYGIPVANIPIDFSEYPLLRGKTAYSTDEISRIAFVNNYDVVVIDNVYDDHSIVGKSSGKTGTDVVYKDPNMIKSSAPVTYDDSGNVIPLSERFNKKNPDIRYSIPDTDSEGRKLTPEQREFFKNSKVVDENGRLKVVYHGTDAEFTVFDKERRGKNYDGDSRFGPGFYFANDRNTALQWTDGTKVIAAYLKMENPLDLRNAASEDLERIIDEHIAEEINNYDKMVSDFPFKDAVVSREQFEENMRSAAERYKKEPSLFLNRFKYDKSGKMTDGIHDFLISLGYDGIISEDEMVVFEPDQIKSVNNTNPTSDPDIRYSLPDGTEESAIYIKDGKKENGETVNFIDEILDGRKLGETRTHKRLTRKWVGMAKDGYVYGRVKLGNPYLITRESPEYKDAMIKGTNYDIAPGESKYYYPVEEVEDFRDNPRPIIRNGNYGRYKYSIDGGYVDYNRNAYLNESTVDKWLEYFAAKSPKNYAQAYIAFFPTSEFVDMSTEDIYQRILRRAETEPLDEEKLRNASVYQPIQLHINEDGQIEGHEGRHRMTALDRAGIRRVPVLLFDSRTKYSKVRKDFFTLKGFGDTNFKTITLKDVIPFSTENREEIIEKFATPSKKEMMFEKALGERIMRFSISDSDYMDAVNSGDMEKAQRMVDQAAKESGYDIGYLYWRGDSDSYNELIPGEDAGNLGTGLYFTEDKRYAERFAGHGGVLRKFYLHKTNGSDITSDGGFEDFREFQDQWLEEKGIDPDDEYIVGECIFDIIDDYIREHDFDYIEGTNVSGLSYGASEIAVQSSWQAKLADPVTYDDDGNVIPLSERFNTENDDIRYSISDPDPVQQFMMNLDEKQGKTPTEAKVIRDYHKAVQALSEEQAYADEIREQLKPRKGFNSFGDEARKLRVILQTTNGRVDRLQNELNRITSRKAYVDIVERSEEVINQISGKTQEEINQIIQDLKSKVSKEKSADRIRELEQQIRDLESEATKRVIDEQMKWRQVIAKDKAAREQRTENARKRAQIGRMVNKLNDLIYKESDKKNIPEEMKPLAKTLVKIFLANDEGNRTKLAFDDKKKIKALKKFYDALDARDKSVMKFDDPDVEDAVNEALNNIRSGIKGLYAEKKGTERLQAVSEALDKIRENTNALYRMIQAQRTVWIKHKAIDLGRAAYMVVQGAEQRNPKGDLTGTLGKGLNSIGRFAFWGNMTPVYFFKNLHNEGMDLLNDAVKDGENRNGLLIQEFRDKIAAIADECGYATWDLDKKHSIKLDNGETVSLTTEQIMSLVATATREATFGPESSSHLEIGGFVYEEQADRMWLGRKVQEQIAHRVTKNDIDAITELLTRGQQAYMHKMVALMSKDASRYGNEASMQMYGIKKFNEEYYFPFAVWDGVKNKASDAGAQTGMPDINRIAHQGFTKRRVNNAQNAILLQNFTDTVVEHLNAMINYSTMAQAIETMNRVLGYKIGENADAEDRATVRNVESIFRERYGANAANYLRKYLKDLNGGAARNQTKSPQERLLTLFRKNAVAGSLSVALQQPLSYIRAANQISTKYLAEALNPKYYRGSMEEMLKHSGVAVIKNMGRFDMNYGRSGVEYMMPEAKKSKGRAAYDAVETASTFLPELMDKVTWTRMWTACKLEQMELHPELTGEALMSATAARFNELMRNTQVYDSVVVRSQNMREQGLGFKTLTSFMAEPTLTANLLADAWANRKDKGGKKALISAVMLFLLSAVAQAGIKGVIGAGRTPDEKKTLAENIAYKYAYNFIGEVNPLSLIPGYDDIVTTLSGGDIKDDSFSAVTKLVDAAVKMVNPETYNKSGMELYRGFEDGIGQVAQIFSGVPLKNLMRDGRAMYNWFLGSYADRGEKARASSWPVVKYQTIDTIMQQDLIGAINKRLKESGGGYGTSNTDYFKRIYEARKAGNGNAADEMSEYLTLGKGVTEEALLSGVSSAAKKDSDTSSAEKADFMYGQGLTDETDYITKEFKAGNLTEKEASDLYKKYFPDMSDNDIYWKIDGLKYQMAHDNSKLGYSMYQGVMDAVETNKADKITAAVNDAVKHGLKTENIAKEISNKFKPIYLAASASEKVKLKDALTKAYKACGLTADQAIKRINGWKVK